LLEAVVHWLMLGRSPQQVARELREQFPSREEMWVSHETIIRVSTSSLEAYSAKS
jgi:IS30 family transposase